MQPSNFVPCHQQICEQSLVSCSVLDVEADDIAALIFSGAIAIDVLNIDNTLLSEASNVIVAAASAILCITQARGCCSVTDGIVPSRNALDGKNAADGIASGFHG